METCFFTGVNSQNLMNCKMEKADASLFCHSAMFDSDVTLTTHSPMTSLADQHSHDPSLLCHSKMATSTEDEAMTSQSQFDVASERVVSEM